VRELERDAFLAWLRELGGKPCGSALLCPIATYLGLIGKFSNINAKILAQDTAWGRAFIRWADKEDRVHQWNLISGDDAADYLESLP